MLKTLRIDYVQVFINTSALLGLLWDKKSSQNALVFCGVEKLPARSWQRASLSPLCPLQLAAAGGQPAGKAAVKLDVCKQPAAPCVREISFLV